MKPQIVQYFDKSISPQFSISIPPENVKNQSYTKEGTEMEIGLEWVKFGPAHKI